MKTLFLALILAAAPGSWSIEILSESKAIIINGLSRSITCYVYYNDGDFKKLFVGAHAESREFSRYGLKGVECF